ncbi:MAG: AI-2E family transporter, partial [Myxococcales bacterium]
MASERTATRVFTALVILSLLLVGVILYPFAEALFMACVLAAALAPLQERLTRRFRGRRALAASLLTTLVVLVLLLPLTGVAAYLATEFARWAQFITETFQSDGMTGLIEALPGPLQSLAERVASAFPVLQEQSSRELQQKLGEQGTRAAAAVGGAVAATGSAVLQTVLMIIALFFLLLDGKRLVRWLEHVSPLKRGEATELLVEFRNVSVAVLVSSMATAAVQTAAAVIGYLIAGVPQPLIFG